MPSTTLRLVFVGLLAAVVLLVGWPWLFAPDERPLTVPGAETGAAASAELDGPAAATPPAATADAATDRAPVPSATLLANATGSLLVKVVWGDDQQPAADVEVEVYRSGADALFEQPHGRSGASGSVLFPEVAPGKVYPQVARASHDSFEPATIVAGQRTEVTLVVKMGMNAKGRVVDEAGAPVAAAEIVISAWSGGQTLTLAESAADGTFSLRAVPTHCHIGARKGGYLPSSLRQFTASEGAEVEFVIVLFRGGGSIAGTVLDPQGRPIAGAAVRVGDDQQRNHRLPDGATAMGPQAELVRTDAAGRFVFASVVPGKVLIAARAQGLAPWRDEIEVAAGRPESVIIHLQLGVTVFGTVHDAAGAPLAKVDVEAGEWSELGRRGQRSAADGTFRLEGLATGPLRMRASHDTLGKCEETLQLTAGEQRRWDPVLSIGLQLLGKVVDADGKPIAEVMVEGSLEGGTPEASWWGMENTDEAGRFTMKNCLPGHTVQLSFRRKSSFPELVVNGVVPGPDERVVTLPKEAWVYIQGTVLGPDDRVLPNVHVSPRQRNGNNSPAETADGKTGAFRYGPYPPGTYSLHLAADGYPAIRLPDRTLGPDEVWDLGTLHFQRGGTLAVQLVGEAAVVPTELTLRVLDPDGSYVDHCKVKAGSGRTGPLVPGNYLLRVSGGPIASRLQPFEIRVDRETRIDVAVQSGSLATVDCILPEGTTRAREVQIVVRDAAQNVVWRGSTWSTHERPATTLALLPGEYQVEATAEMLRAAATLVVTAAGPSKVTLALRQP